MIIVTMKIFMKLKEIDDLETVDKIKDHMS